MKKLSEQIDRKILRLDGMSKQLDYIINDLLNATADDLDVNNRFFALNALNDEMTIKRAVPVLNNLRDDLEDISDLMTEVYAPVSESEKPAFESDASLNLVYKK